MTKVMLIAVALAWAQNLHGEWSFEVTAMTLHEFPTKEACELVKNRMWSMTKRESGTVPRTGTRREQSAQPCRSRGRLNDKSDFEGRNGDPGFGIGPRDQPGSGCVAL
jgi:hypothetical protein